MTMEGENEEIKKLLEWIWDDEHATWRMNLLKISVGSRHLRALKFSQDKTKY